MDRESNKDEKLPSDDPAIERDAERSREALDNVPAPGTDPLHEGP